MTPAISIVVPVYNVAPFIGKCLESLWDQDFPESGYEVVVVDDGSTDESAEIAAKIVSAHRNGRIVSQENRGLSEARNRGLQEAAGEYVWFVDSDDWIEKDCLGRIVAEVSGSDILAIGAENYTESGLRSGVFSYSGSGVMPGERFLCLRRDQLNPCAPFYVFRREFLISNHLSFYPGIYHEDSEFTPRAVAVAGSVAVSTGTYYKRLVREGSIMRTINPKRPKDMLTAMKSVYAFTQERISSGGTRTALYDFISNSLNYACKISGYTDLSDRKGFADLLSRENWIGGVLIHSSKMKFIVEGFLLSVFPRRLQAIHDFLMLFNPKKNRRI